MAYHHNYCLDCDWNASTENHSRQELANLVMEHFQETQHHIEGEKSPESDGFPLNEIQWDTELREDWQNKN